MWKRGLRIYGSYKCIYKYICEYFILGQCSLNPILSSEENHMLILQKMQLHSLEIEMIQIFKERYQYSHAVS